MTPTPQHPHPVPQWPTPIDGRTTPPTSADADDTGHVQFLDSEGRWGRCTWQSAANDADQWLHTPQWRPRTTAAAALNALNTLRAVAISTDSPLGDDFDTIEAFIAQHPDATP